MTEDKQISIPAQIAEMNSAPATPSPIPRKYKTAGQHYGGPLGGDHQVRPAPKVAVVYENAEIQDLYMRLKKVFAEMGHEF